MHRFAIAIAFLVAATLPIPAAAQLFGNDEFEKEVRTRLKKLEETAADRRLLVDLAAQIDALRADVASMRGQIEVLANSIVTLEKRQKDLYLDIDTRLRKLEPATPGATPAAGGDTQSSPDEAKAYEAALNQFKLGKYSTAISAFEGFLKTYPASPLAPSAQYWIGNSYFAKRDYRNAMKAQQKVLSTWPTNPKAADAMLNIASSQEALRDGKGARRTLDDLIKKYPASPAAASAKQRLAQSSRR